MHSKNFTKGKNPRIIQGEVFTDKDIPPFMDMKEWNIKHNLGNKKWIQEFVKKRSNYLMEQDNMINVKGYTQPEFPTAEFESPDAFRDYYTANVNPDYDWKNTTHWGKQHQGAFDAARKAKSMEPSEFMTDPNASIQDFGPTGTGHGSILQPFNPIIPGPAQDKYITTSKDRPGPPPTLPAAYPESTGTPLTINPIDQSYDLFDPNITPNRPEYSGTNALMSWLGGDFADEYMPNLAQGQKEWDAEHGPIVTKTKIEEPEQDISSFFPNTPSLKNENRRIVEIKQRINEMVEDGLKDNQLGNGKAISGEPKDIKYKVGMEVQDINPDCPHRDSRGVVTKANNGEVTYKVTNFGRHFSPGDELTKSVDQLIPLSSGDRPWYIAGE